MTINEITEATIGVAIEMHCALGPGLLESAYKHAQLLTYLCVGGWKLGLLINFNVALLRNGIHRRVLGLEE
jgi:hypothetical protein